MVAQARKITKFLFVLNEELLALCNVLPLPTVRSRSTHFHFIQGITMKYLLLCQFQPAAMAHAPAEAMAQVMQSMMAFNQQLIQAGVLLAAGQLAPPESAQRVFAEKGRIKTKEGMALAGETQIGGYYLIDVPGEPEATGWAAKCPAAQFGALEVRQVAYSPV
jgi:hypothetical protein